MDNDQRLLAELLVGMRATYRAGGNAMAYAREKLAGAGSRNSTVATLIAYDLQAGSYVDKARQDPAYNATWCRQLADLIAPLAAPGDSVLEVGCGEATTLAGVLRELARFEPRGLGFDISWSRIKVANEWLAERQVAARLFVADLFAMPLATGSVDIVYTSHSLEPNGGREREGLAELLRVARKYVVLVEPAYELAGDAARERMASHGYVRGLRAIAESLPVEILDHRLLPVIANPLNPSGVLVLKRTAIPAPPANLWQCPLSATPLVERDDAMAAPEAGLAYPMLRGIPLLRAEHAVVASHLDG